MTIIGRLKTNKLTRRNIFQWEPYEWLFLSWFFWPHTFLWFSTKFSSLFLWVKFHYTLRTLHALFSLNMLLRTSASRIFVAGLQIGHVLHSKLFIYRLVINQASIIIPLVLRIFRIKPSISFRIYFLCPWPVIFLWGNVEHFDFDLVFRFQLVTWAVGACRLPHSHKWWLLKLRGFNFKTDRLGLPVKLRNGHSLGSTNVSVEVLMTR